MDSQRSPLHTWAYYYQGKSMEELNHSLLCKTLELESTRVAAQEELRRRDEQLTHLRDLLSRCIRERDEAHERCQKLLIDKILLYQNHQQQTGPLSGISSIEDEPRRGMDSNNGFSSSDCEESIVSSPVLDQIAHRPKFPLQPPPPPPPPPPTVQAIVGDATLELVHEKPLPEKGKLLQAVMKAGPLLQTLLLAGPLPQWRHPPPPIDTLEIPPVTIPSPPHSYLLHQEPNLINLNVGNSSINQSCGRVDRKRAFREGSDSSQETKLLRVVLH